MYGRQAGSGRLIVGGDANRWLFGQASVFSEPTSDTPLSVNAYNALFPAYGPGRAYLSTGRYGTLFAPDNAMESHFPEID